MAFYLQALGHQHAFSSQHLHQPLKNTGGTSATGKVWEGAGRGYLQEREPSGHQANEGEGGGVPKLFNPAKTEGKLQVPSCRKACLNLPYKTHPTARSQQAIPLPCGLLGQTWEAERRGQPRPLSPKTHQHGSPELSQKQPLPGLYVSRRSAWRRLPAR